MPVQLRKQELSTPDILLSRLSDTHHFYAVFVTLSPENRIFSEKNPYLLQIGCFFYKNRVSGVSDVLHLVAVSALSFEVA